ncbi:hypothetical protein PDE_04009 [Penicillium oxalicum 114-2]|uniref:C6 finger transcription factor poxB n=2 Tax=Penicillium oxalicum TaxID=69781 RepID=POXB_PENO1|nr:RecName: Full=C6 finger transcription factor poxB; AltName: Full=Oxaleimides biosynthesis cluster protein B [Penicillium oxalicum]S8B3H6.1 RecName: Full=C6 finger transcription factor poxB; AltName: Full=Oxaleimides biosynthesis cluster protein B [Penicillium oxalicum 114-2]ARF05976.1 PoxB [Penicillium oxalicum]EPS29062.1 hypothetical protein PDE_04009 [Penicillium oxalicum 114-2]
MSEAEPSVVVAEQCRRSACDRCRGQKLRCERPVSNSSTTPCRRCLKAHVRCVTTAQPHRTKPLSSLQYLHHTESNYDPHSATVAGQLPVAAVAGLGDLDPSLLHMTGVQNPRRLSHSSSMANPVDSRPPGRTRRLSNPDHFLPHPPLHPNGVLDTDGTPLLDSIDHLPDMTASRGFGFSAALTPHSPSGSSDFFDYFRPMAEDNNRSPWMDAFTNLPPDHREGTPAGSNYRGSLTGENQFRSSLQSSRGLNGFETPQRESRHREMDIVSIKNECIARMGKLNRGLLQDVGLVNSGKVAGTLLFSQASRSTYLEVEKGRKGGQNYVIGKMLHSSKELLDILKQLERCKSTLFPPGHTERTTSTADEVTTAMTETTTLNQTGSHAPSSPLGGNPLPPLSGPLSASASHSSSCASSSSASASTSGASLLSSSTSAPSTSPAISLQLDTTLTLLFLTGYTSVIQLYEGVFSFIRDSVAANPSGSNFLPTLPKLQVDGFEVGSSTRDLQICILLQVSTHILNQIEERLHAIRDRAEGHVPAALLDTILDRSDPSQRGAKGRELCRIVRDIKEHLKHYAE